MKNAEVAERLFEIADLLEMQDVEFKPRAYRRAARNIEALTEAVEEVDERGELETIDGVGASIAEKVHEYLETGQIGYLDELKEEMPADIEALTAVEGLGPKRVEALYEALGIETLDDLETAARGGRIAEVEGFGEKTQQRILEHIPLARAGQERMLLGRAFPIVEEILGELETAGAFDTLEAVGSFRRGLPTIGDVDILATAGSAEDAMEAFVDLGDVDEVLSRGETKASVRLSGGLQVDLRVVDTAEIGSALLYFTGSKDHNIQVRQLAQEDDLKLNEYGLFDGEDRIAGETEQEVYEALGLAWIPPELREATGEIEAARQGSLPTLVEQDEIQGDLQMHTTWSDGRTSIQGMAKKADALGYAYILITDHGPALSIAQGPDADDLEEMRTEVDDVNEAVDVEVLLGIEANIDHAGDLDVAAEVCERLDLVVASLHERAEDATERILTAIEAYPVDIIAHPTNRLIGSRDPNPLDLDRLAKACDANQVALEINSQPERLDLPWRDVEELRGRVPFVVSTDAHHPDQMETMRLGVLQARKGWLRAEDVLNTRPLDELIETLRG